MGDYRVVREYIVLFLRPSRNGCKLMVSDKELSTEQEHLFRIIGRTESFSG